MELSSDDEIDMQKYIKPVRKMLGDYKKSLYSLKTPSGIETESA